MRFILIIFLFLCKSNTHLGQEKAQVEEEKGAAKVQLKELILERDNLKGKVRELSNKVEQLNQAVQEFKTTERMMEQRTKQLEVRGRCKQHVSFAFVSGGF